MTMNALASPSSAFPTGLASLPFGRDQEKPAGKGGKKSWTRT
jgi:hypothetical protein